VMSKWAAGRAALTGVGSVQWVGSNESELEVLSRLLF